MKRLKIGPHCYPDMIRQTVRGETVTHTNLKAT